MRAPSRVAYPTVSRWLKASPNSSMISSSIATMGTMTMNSTTLWPRSSLRASTAWGLRPASHVHHFWGSIRKALRIVKSIVPLVPPLNMPMTAESGVRRL